MSQASRIVTRDLTIFGVFAFFSEPLLTQRQGTCVELAQMLAVPLARYRSDASREDIRIEALELDRSP